MGVRVKKMLYRALCEREEGKDYVKTLNEITYLAMGIDEEYREEYGFLMFFYKLRTLDFLSYPHFRKLIFDLMGMLDRGEVNGFK